MIRKVEPEKREIERNTGTISFPILHGLCAQTRGVFLVLVII